MTVKLTEIPKTKSPSKFLAIFLSMAVHNRVSPSLFITSFILITSLIPIALRHYADVCPVCSTAHPMVLPCSSTAVLTDSPTPQHSCNTQAILCLLGMFAGYFIAIAEGERAKTRSLLKPEGLVHRARTTHRYLTLTCQVA